MILEGQLNKTSLKKHPHKTNSYLDFKLVFNSRKFLLRGKIVFVTIQFFSGNFFPALKNVLILAHIKSTGTVISLIGQYWPIASTNWCISWALVLYRKCKFKASTQPKTTLLKKLIFCETLSWGSYFKLHLSCSNTPMLIKASTVISDMLILISG